MNKVLIRITNTAVPTGPETVKKLFMWNFVPRVGECFRPGGCRPLIIGQAITYEDGRVDLLIIEHISPMEWKSMIRDHYWEREPVNMTVGKPPSVTRTPTVIEP